MAALPNILNETAAEAVADADRANRSVYRVGHSIYLMPAARNRATEAFAPLWLAPPAARVVAVGRHEFLDASAAAWINDRNEIEVALDADIIETGRAVLMRVYTRETEIVCGAAVFEARGARAVAAAVLTTWNGLPVAGFLSILRRGSEL